MSVDELLDLIDETLEEGTGLPFTGGKRMVDVEKLQEMLDEIRLNLPTELRQAKAIVNDRADIVNSARKEADGIVRKAEERARQLVSEENVTKAAQARAAEILSTAQSQARELRSKTLEYCDNLLKATCVRLTRSASYVKRVRENVRQMGRGGNGGTGSTHAKACHKDQIEDQIDHRGNGDEHQGALGISHAPENGA